MSKKFLGAALVIALIGFNSITASAMVGRVAGRFASNINNIMKTSRGIVQTNHFKNINTTGTTPAGALLKMREGLRGTNSGVILTNNYTPGTVYLNDKLGGGIRGTYIPANRYPHFK